MRPGCIDDFTVGTDHSTIRSIFTRQPLDDLIGPFPSLGINHLDTGAMFPAFKWLSLLPAVEHDRERMALSMTIRGQISKQ